MPYTISIREILWCLCHFENPNLPFLSRIVCSIFSLIHKLFISHCLFHIHIHIYFSFLLFRHSFISIFRHMSHIYLILNTYVLLFIYYVSSVLAFVKMRICRWWNIILSSLHMWTFYPLNTRDIERLWCWLLVSKVHRVILTLF